MDFDSILLAKKLSGGGGGGSATLIDKNISSNGTYNASSDSADGYKKVVVSVPNTYVAGDEGKVVSNGALVSQSSATYDQNGTYDTTLKNSVTVDVPSGITLQEMANGTKPSGVLDITGLSFISGAFQGRTGITGITGTGTVMGDVFRSCPNLQNIHVSITSGSGCNTVFGYCTKLETAVLVNSVDFGNAKFHSCSKLKTADFGCSRIRTNEFYNCYVFDTLILRSTSIVTLENASAFTNTKFKSGGSGGTIYIPKSLYDHLGDGTSSDYQHATNWSTVHGYGTITWAKIEGTIYETQYADGTPIGS